MRLFDIVLFEAGRELAKKLGFSGMVHIGGRFPHGSLLNAHGQPELFRSANNPVVRCIAMDKALVGGAVIGKLSGLGKPLLVSANSIVTQDREETIRNIGSLKRSLSRTKLKGIDMGLASFAKDHNELFSCAQLLELSKLVGISEDMERRALSSIGDVFAEKE